MITGLVQHLVRKLHPGRVYFSYRGFYDVPEAILAKLNGRDILFVRYFDEELDDYTSSYSVYELTDVSKEDPDVIWNRIEKISKTLLCEIPLNQIEFDENRRHW